MIADHPTQAESILRYLEAHPDGMTALDALDLFGCFRLAARINDLRNRGHAITTTDVRTASGKHIARYLLAPTSMRTPA